MLSTFSGTDHVQQAKRFKNETEKRTKWTDLRVVHMEDRSELYKGIYPSIKAAQGDLAKAKEWVAPAGYPPYKNAIVVVVPGQYVGPAELNLRNAKGAYTVVVAVFYNVPANNYLTRKTDAVSYCQRLRANNYEAYYYHGPVNSLVTVGSFPESSVRMVTEKGVTKPKIVDSRINAIMKEEQFEYLAINGQREFYRSASAVSGSQAKVEGKYARPYPAHIPKDSDKDVSSSYDSYSH